MFQREFNPLLSRRRSRRALSLALLAGLGLVATGALAVSASTPSAPQGQALSLSRTGQPAEARVAQAEGAAPVVQAAPQRRQVRVIPLFNTPSNPTGK